MGEKNLLKLNVPKMRLNNINLKRNMQHSQTHGILPPPPTMIFSSELKVRQCDSNECGD